jgi:hypothetical protein
MTDDQRFLMVISVLGAVPLIGVVRYKCIPEGTAISAGYTPGVLRLGVPALQSSDASVAITNPGYRPDDKGAMALPASIVVGSSFNPELAGEGGAMIGGREARIRRFNAMLARRHQPRPRCAQRPELRVLLRGSAAQRRPRRRGHQSTASRARASSRHSSTTRSTATRPTATGSTQPSTRTRTASRTCSPSTSRSSARSPAPS